MSLRDDIRKDVLSKLKGLSETITDSVGDIAKGKNIFCAPTDTNSRLSICKSCAEFNASTTQCKRCGCFMSAKTRLKNASCPIGKWGRVA